MVRRIDRAAMMTAAPGSRWLIRRANRPDATANLYCFPHVGGSPGEYVRWSDDLPGIQIWGIRAPSQPGRTDEAPYTRMDAMVDAIVAEVPFQRPFALFGHSLGALVAFEVAHQLRRRNLPGPGHLYLSACPPPPASRGRILHTLPDDHLFSEIERRWGRLPADVRVKSELRSHVLSRCRADLEVLETYRPAVTTPLDCPLTTICGTDDASSARLSEWHAYTRGRFSSRTLPGDHFYFRQRRHELLRIIHRDLCGEALTAD